MPVTAGKPVMSPRYFERQQQKTDVRNYRELAAAAVAVVPGASVPEYADVHPMPGGAFV